MKMKTNLLLLTLIACLTTSISFAGGDGYCAEATERFQLTMQLCEKYISGTITVEELAALKKFVQDDGMETLAILKKSRGTPLTPEDMILLARGNRIKENPHKINNSISKYK